MISSNPGVLVGRKAPDFCAAAVLGNGEIVSEYRLSQVAQNKYAMLCFYPLDFTFVCPSELIALNNRMDEFKKRSVEVIGISIDSQFTHHAWRNTSVKKVELVLWHLHWSQISIIIFVKCTALSTQSLELLYVAHF